MKAALFTMVLIAAPIVNAAEIYTQFPDGSRAIGIHENFGEQRAPKLCFTGDSNKICSDVRSSISQVNSVLAQEGAETKLRVKACAQSIKLAMLIYSFKSVETDNQVKKTVYIKECK